MRRDTGEVKIITAEMTIGDVIERFPATIAVFNQFGLHCRECQIASLEDIEHGANVHRVDIADLIRELNRAIDSKL